MSVSVESHPDVAGEIVRPSGRAHGPTAGSAWAKDHWGGFQGDVEGLRAIAVLGVVAFHAAVPWMPGGYVGVDVFLVISGYLISGLLVRELLGSGRVSLRNFYARRARRILPMACIVLVLSSLAVWWCLPTLTGYRAQKDILSAGLYVSNWRFIDQGTNYLAPSTDHSVVLHYWSLSVEEQFYLVWPALLWLTWIVARKLKRWWLFPVIVGAVTAASWTWCVADASSQPAAAYMSTFTRAWQFGVGAMLAVAVHAGWLTKKIPRVIGPLAGWLGAALVIGSMTLVSSSTSQYPGWIASLPVLGAAGVIVSGRLTGTGAGTVGAVLTFRWMRTMGRWSYGWYLWHWPILVLVQAKTGALGWPVLVLLSVVALVLAAVSSRLVERPVMNSAQLRGRPTASLSVGLLSTIVATGTALAMGTLAVITLSNVPSQTDASTFASVFGADTGKHSGPVNPSPLKAGGDVPDRNAECLLDTQVTSSPDCVFGDPTGIPVVLFGDSHAQQWQPALQKLAIPHHWALYVRAKMGCPAADFVPRAGDTNRISQPDCPAWRHAIISEITAMRPALIFVSSMRLYSSDSTESLTAWNKTFDALRPSGARIVYIRDTPYPGIEIPDCMSSSLDDWDRCGFGRNAYTGAEPVVNEVARGNEPDVSVIDLDGYLCNGNTCPAVRNGTLLYRDHSHLSATAATLLAPALDQQLASGTVG
jgi:peptidoglycan/LPS O-acetylase OafA/YrhL